MKNIIGIILARMASSRFPGKPLALILGVPMIGHVYYRSKMSKLMEEVYVATCDEEIKGYTEFHWNFLKPISKGQYFWSISALTFYNVL